MGMMRGPPVVSQSLSWFGPARLGVADSRRRVTMDGHLSESSRQVSAEYKLAVVQVRKDTF